MRHSGNETVTSYLMCNSWTCETGYGDCPANISEARGEKWKRKNIYMYIYINTRHENVREKNWQYRGNAKLDKFPNKTRPGWLFRKYLTWRCASHELTIMRFDARIKKNVHVNSDPAEMAEKYNFVYCLLCKIMKKMAIITRARVSKESMSFLIKKVSALCKKTHNGYENGAIYLHIQNTIKRSIDPDAWLFIWTRVKVFSPTMNIVNHLSAWTQIN